MSVSVELCDSDVSILANSLRTIGGIRELAKTDAY